MLENFLTKTPTDGFIHIYPGKDKEIIKVKPPSQKTVDLVYCAQHDIFLDSDGLVYIIKNDDPKSIKKSNKRNRKKKRRTHF